MSICKYIVPWIGMCGKELPCKEHTDKKCISCGKPATRGCPETGQFVCGYHLCDDCEHTIFADGTNGGVGFNEQPLDDIITHRHVRKTEQVFTPWYMEQNPKQ